MHEFSFNGQRDGEKVMEVVKNHPFVLFLPGLETVLAFAIGAAVMIFFTESQISGVILLVAIAVGLGIFGRAYYNYSQSVLLITNQRLINVHQDGFLKRKIIETDMDKIQDASSEVKGLFKVMLKFGDLIIRTAGATAGTEILVENIPNPYEVQQRIAKMRSK
jgi:hypothetical protein